MEDLWNEPPPDTWRMTKDPTTAPAGSVEITLGFEGGVPVSLNGETMNGVRLIKTLNELAGTYGIGRIDMVENRVVGLKSREVYERPVLPLFTWRIRLLKELFWIEQPSTIPDRLHVTMPISFMMDCGLVLYALVWMDSSMRHKRM